MPAAVYTANFGPHNPSHSPDFPALRSLNFLAPAREYYYLHSWPLALSNHIFWKLSRSSIFPCQRLFSLFAVFLHSKYQCYNSLDFSTVDLNLLENNNKNCQYVSSGNKIFLIPHFHVFPLRKKLICSLIVSCCLTAPGTDTVQSN